MNKLKSIRKIKLKYLLLSFLVLSLLITGAYALFKGFDKSENVFTVGNVKIELTEPNWEPNHDSDGDGINDTLLNILPGQTIDKDPTITNVGLNDAFVYMLVEIPKAYNVDLSTLTGEQINKKYYPLFKFKNNIDENWALINERSVNEEQGMYYENEGYDCFLYGYKTPITKDESVTLFNSVEFENITSNSADLINELGGLNVKVRAYAIQSDFYGDENISVDKAWNKFVNQNEWQWPHEDLKKVVALNYVDEEGKTLLIEPTEPESEVELYFDSSLARNGYTFDWINISTNEVANNGMVMPNNNMTLMTNYTETGYSNSGSPYVMYEVVKDSNNEKYLSVVGLDTSHSEYPKQPSTLIIPSEVTFKTPNPLFTTNGYLLENEIYTLPVKTISQASLKTHSKVIDTLIIGDGITEIGNSAMGDSPFNKNTTLRKVILPYGLKTIGESAFNSCTNLQEINIPNSVTNIGEKAFFSCKNLKEITIPDNVKSILSSTFSYCENLKNVTLPNNLIELKNYAFSACTNLISIEIPNTLNYMGSNVFSGSGLQEINIPDSVTTIDRNPFFNCKKLTAIYVDNNNPYYADIDGVLFNKNKTELIKYPENAPYTQYEVPFTVTKVLGNSINFCQNLKTISFANPDTKLDPVVFQNSNVELVVLPQNITSIPDYTFGHCKNLKTITLPPNVNSIEYGAFYGCSSLKNITLPQTLTIINKRTFSGCSSLEEIIIPDSVTSIDEAAFSGCTGLKELTLPVSTKINYYNTSDYRPFIGCKNIEKITLTVGTGTMKEYDNNSYVGTPWYISGCSNIYIEDGVKNISNYAFARCKFTSIVIPNSVTTIGSSAFDMCTNLTSITIPDGVAIIDKRTFYGCENLTKVTLPDSVTSIGYMAFRGCTNLNSITIPNNLTSIGDYALYQCEKLKFISLPNSITSIGERAFSNCASLESITIPESVISIGAWAFWNCSNLTSITIPDKITVIENGTFSDCANLTSITISNKLSSINDNAFKNCTKILDVYYNGTEEQWEAITIGTNNDILSSATIHYNS